MRISSLSGVATLTGTFGPGTKKIRFGNKLPDDCQKPTF